MSASAPSSQSSGVRPRIAMLGGGNMNGAILTALLDAGFGGDEPIRVTTRTAASAARFAEEPRVEAVASDEVPDANRDAVRDADVVVLGVKPPGIVPLAEAVAAALKPGAVVISIAAGVPCAAIEAALPEGSRVVRAMPNTPALIGEGVTGICAGSAADDEAMALAREIFECVGSCVEVPEEKIAAVGALSGSGPAYVYLLAEHLIAAGVEQGLSAADARELVVGTIRGAAGMLQHRADVSPAELRRRVTSPNGTTERSIRVFTDARFDETVKAAVQANIDRAAELAAESAQPADTEA